MPGLFADCLLNYAILFFAGFAAYIISTLSGGGGSLLLVPLVNWLIGGKSTAPVINLGNLIGQPIRILLFWKYIDWKVTRYYVLPAIAGTLLSAWIFSNLKLEWLQIVVGLFLISSIFQYGFGKKERSFKMGLKGFIPAWVYRCFLFHDHWCNWPSFKSFLFKLWFGKRKNDCY